jgi:hypothetical protein
MNTLMINQDFRAVTGGTAARPDTRPRAAALDLDQQTKWHTTLNDQFKNFYRTSYQDHIFGREVAVKSMKPEGYGGYDVYKGANEMYRNTEFEKMQQVIKNDETRLRFPDFAPQKDGLPDFTANPKGKSTQKTAYTIPTTGFVVPPFSVDQFGLVLNFRRDVTVLPPYEQRLPQASTNQMAGRAADVAPAAPSPPKLSVQTDAQDEPYVAGPALAPSSESARLSAVATYVLNNGTRSPRKGESPRKSPKQLFS